MAIFMVHLERDPRRGSCRVTAIATGPTGSRPDALMHIGVDANCFPDYTSWRPPARAGFPSGRSQPAHTK
jgi:hypothetical protein